MFKINNENTRTTSLTSLTLIHTRQVQWLAGFTSRWINVFLFHVLFSGSLSGKYFSAKSDTTFYQLGICMILGFFVVWLITLVIKMRYRFRILYGKLQRKGGFGVSGKSSASTKRNIVMQFLSHCSEDDIEIFISLIVEPFKCYKGKFLQ